MNTTLENLNRLLKQNFNNFYTGNISHTSYIKNSLVISRLMAQRITEKLCETIEKHNELYRINDRYECQGVRIITIPYQLKKLGDDKGLYKEILGMVGSILIDSLDEWQRYGATYDDLFNFCCCSESTIDRMKKNIADGYTSFSDLVCTHYPDCKSKFNYVDLQDYCPITHAVSEYMCQTLKGALTSDPLLKEEARRQLSELYLGIIGLAIGDSSDFEIYKISDITENEE